MVRCTIKKWKVVVIAIRWKNERLSIKCPALFTESVLPLASGFPD